MSSFDDYLNSMGIQKAAVVLDKHGPLTNRQFTERTGFSNEYVAKIRNLMESWGLVSLGWQDKRSFLIALTPAGKKYVQLVYQEGELIDEGARGKRPNRS